MKAQKGSIGTAVIFLLTLDIEELGGQRHDLTAFTARNDPLSNIQEAV
jgi:hypothetical protein